MVQESLFKSILFIIVLGLLMALVPLDDGGALPAGERSVMSLIPRPRPRDDGKRKWIGMFAHHMSLGIGGVLPLQVILTDLTC